MVYRYGIYLHVIHCNDLERSLILRHVTGNTVGTITPTALVIFVAQDQRKHGDVIS